MYLQNKVHCSFFIIPQEDITYPKGFMLSAQTPTVSTALCLCHIWHMQEFLRLCLLSHVTWPDSIWWIFPLPWRYANTLCPLRSDKVPQRTSPDEIPISITYFQTPACERKEHIIWIQHYRLFFHPINLRSYWCKAIKGPDVDGVDPEANTTLWGPYCLNRSMKAMQGYSLQTPLG